MRMIQRNLWTSTEAGLVVTVTVCVILGLLVSVQDSYGGYCDGDGTCCISNADCAPYSCLNTKGFCSNLSVYDSTLCNVDSDCPLDEWCAHAGNCVGGESDGESCSAEATGFCGVAWPPNELCRTDEDCDDPLYPDCEPFLEDQCPGGTCVVWGTCPTCYIATAAFGTELEDKTDILRSFRDEYLLTNAAGKAFVAAYYKYSPPLAHYIAERDWMKTLVRILLLPVIGLLSLFV